MQAQRQWKEVYARGIMEEATWKDKPDLDLRGKNTGTSEGNIVQEKKTLALAVRW